MDKLKFKIIDACFQDAINIAPDNADFFLEQNDWNDYYFYTTYHLHVTKKLTKTENVYLGPIKILKIGQKKDENRVLEKELKSKRLGTIIESLPLNYYSISFSLELYLGLNKYLNEKQKKEFVKAMRMILSINSPYYKDVENEPAFLKSFLRDSDMDSYVLKKAKNIMCKDGLPIEWENQEVSIKFAKADSQIKLDFSGITNAADIDNIPSGIIAFIGHNGCGKSTSLYQIAKLLFANPSDRWHYKDIGELAPTSTGINKLLFFTYSAFDNFILPGLTLSDYRLICNGLEDNTGRFVFCGVRDVKRELGMYIDEYILKNEHEENVFILKEASHDHQESILLKPIEQLAQEFAKAFQTVKNVGRTSLLNKVIEDSEIILPSLYTEISWLTDELVDEQTMQDIFLQKSTGIKFFLHSIMHLIAYMEDNSIVLFDEPENHLHPPFLSFMMKSFRMIIHEIHSVMLVATHSPVILQETLSKNVFVLRRDGDLLNFEHPRIETYGESFGFINTYVFGLNTEITSYHSTIDLLFEKWDCNNLDSISNVLTRFRQRMNVESLSSQIEAYIINKYYENHVEA